MRERSDAPPGLAAPLQPAVHAAPFLTTDVPFGLVGVLRVGDVRARDYGAVAAGDPGRSNVTPHPDACASCPAGSGSGTSVTPRPPRPCGADELPVDSYHPVQSSEDDAHDCPRRKGVATARRQCPLNDAAWAWRIRR